MTDTYSNGLAPVQIQAVEPNGNTFFIGVTDLGGFFGVGRVAPAETFFIRGSNLGYCGGTKTYIADTDGTSDKATVFLDPDGQAFGPLVTVEQVGNTLVLSSGNRNIVQRCDNNLSINRFVDNTCVTLILNRIDL